MTFQLGRPPRSQEGKSRDSQKGDGGWARSDKTVALALTDVDWNILATNRPWMQRAAATGLQAYLEPGHNFEIFCREFSAERRAQSPRLPQLKALANGEIKNLRHAFKLPDGSRVEIAVDLLEIKGDRFATLVIVGSDQSTEFRERPFPDESLQEARLLLIRVLGEERRSVARDLHDSAGQYLTALSLALTRMRQIDCNMEMSTLINEMGSLLDDFHLRIRGITYVLHPPELEDAGLCAALKSLCDGLARRALLKIDLRAQGDRLARKDRAEAIAYRVIQEGLTNVLRHAQGTAVQVRLCLRVDSVLLVVRDNGVGLRNQPKASAGNLELGVGIAGITARVCKLGGRFIFRDAHGQSGTFLAAVLPRGRNSAADDFGSAGVIPRALIDRFLY